MLEIKTDADIDFADALIALQGAYDREDETQTRLQLGNVLAYTNGPDWRQDAVLVDRIKVVGVFEAAKGLLRKHLR